MTDRKKFSSTVGTAALENSAAKRSASREMYAAITRSLMRSISWIADDSGALYSSTCPTSGVAGVGSTGGLGRGHMTMASTTIFAAAMKKNAFRTF